MKFLCPVDFSKHSIHALKYGIELANSSNAEIHLCTVCYTGNQADAIVDFDGVVLQRAQDDMDKLIAGIAPLIRTDHVPIQVILKGFAEDAILEYASEHDIDLIIMGTRGRSKVQKFLFGSVTRKVLKRSSIPLLVIPEILIDNADFGNIILALDSEHIKDTHTFSFLLKLSKIKGRKIDVFHVGYRLDYFPVDPIIEDCLGSQMNELIIEESDMPAIAIAEYAKTQHIGLIAMLKRKKGFFERILNSSVTEKELGVTQVPLLILSES